MGKIINQLLSNKSIHKSDNERKENFPPKTLDLKALDSANMLPTQLQRKKYIHEQHEAGRTYISLAKELEISPERVRQLDLKWKHYLQMQESWPRDLPIPKPLFSVFPKPFRKR